MNSGVINFAVYENGSEFLGMAKCTMPDMIQKVFTVNGAGIAGDVEIPAIGHIDSMKASFEFTDSNDGAYKLSESRRHLLDCRVAHEDLDKTKGVLAVSSHKYVIDCIPISRNGGDVAPVTSHTRTVEVSVLSVKEYVDGKLVSDIDPINFRFVDVSGKNRLAEVAKALGK